MIVYINEQPVEIFNGADLGHVVLKYSSRSYKMVCTGKLAIFDKYGFKTEPDAPVKEGQKFFVKRTNH
jgi:hypothetical protein